MPIQAFALTFRHADEQELFHDLHFSVERGRIGLVGANGCGKSTLLRILAGELAPSTGSVRVDGHVGFYRQSAARAIASGGEAAWRELMRLWREAPDVLLLDEPSNHLDREARAELRERLARWRGTVIVASHDRELLGSVDAIWELADGTLRVYGGDYAFYERRRAEERDAAERDAQGARSRLDRARRDKQRQRERQSKRMSTAARQAPDLGLPRIIIGLRKRQAQSTQARLEGVHERRTAEAEARWREARGKLSDDEPPAFDLPDPRIPRARTVLSLRDAGLAISGPQKVALVGPNGGGKTTLLRRILAGAPDITVHAARIAYLDQDLLQLDPERTLFENMRRFAPAGDETELRIRLGRARFAQHESAKRARELSGGEALRATLACALAGEPPAELLLLDEPTNHLDIPALHSLERAIAAFRGAVIVVSHDEAFLRAIEWSQIWELTDGVVRRQK